MFESYHLLYVCNVESLCYRRLNDLYERCFNAESIFVALFIFSNASMSPFLYGAHTEEQ